MSSCNVVIIPVDGSKNSERAVDCEYFLKFNIMWCTLYQMFYVACMVRSISLAITDCSFISGSDDIIE